MKDTNFNQERPNTPRSTVKPWTDNADTTDVSDIVKRAQEAAIKATAAAEENLVGKYSHRVSFDADSYARLFDAVRKDISLLRVTLEGAEAKELERKWLRHKTHGELDDTKLVDGATGDRAVYRVRGKSPPSVGTPQRRPKRLAFVMDVSASMARFNGADRRLDRMLATSLMIMEAFRGFEHKYDYSILGHDGEGPRIPFVKFGKPPTSVEERQRVLGMMDANARYCMSGDHTLAAVHAAVNEVGKEPADDYITVALSDANVQTYGITPKALTKVMQADPKVHVFAIFLCGDASADTLVRGLAPGHGFVCTNTAELPTIFRQIFQKAVLSRSRL
mmetsp:Transcript_63719/g.138595  ORF Transcript_63719/g.138595 Transcript_63719/m.138595 type:complete len:334 (+) Transcript_63719:3-1004(+)